LIRSARHPIPILHRITHPHPPIPQHTHPPTPEAPDSTKMENQPAEKLFVIECLVGKRVSRRDGRLKYRARWVGEGPEGGTWESVDRLVSGGCGWLGGPLPLFPWVHWVGGLPSHLTRSAPVRNSTHWKKAAGASDTALQLGSPGSRRPACTSRRSVALWGSRRRRRAAVPPAGPGGSRGVGRQQSAELPVQADRSLWHQLKPIQPKTVSTTHSTSQPPEGVRKRTLCCYSALRPAVGEVVRRGDCSC
jgi:hypothetical protein